MSQIIRRTMSLKITFFQKMSNFILAAYLLSSVFCSPVIAQEDISGLVKKILPSVVTVNVFSRQGQWRGGGTGFLVEGKGLLVTDRHVIDGKADAIAKFSNGEFIRVEGLLSEDTSGDLVLLALGGKEISLPALRLTDSEIKAGQRIIVIGSPLGHEGTVLQGVISEVKDIPNFGRIFKHTATVSHGSSGSPILNMEGEVVGAVIGYFVIEGKNVGFAVSVDRLKWLLSHSRMPSHELLELVDREEERWLAALLEGRYEELINLLSERIKTSPNNALMHFYLGSAFSKLSRIHEAIEAYKQAIRLEPDDSDFYYNLGVSFIRVGNFSQAIETFKRAIRVNPANAEALMNLGFSYSELCRYKEAIEAYERAVQIKPDFADAHYNLGEAYLKVKKRKKATEEYMVLKNLKPELSNKLLELIGKQ